MEISADYRRHGGGLHGRTAATGVGGEVGLGSSGERWCKRPENGWQDKRAEGRGAEQVIVDGRLCQCAFSR